MRNRILRMFAITLMWLFPCLAVWYVAAGPIAWIPAKLSVPALSWAAGPVKSTQIERGTVTYSLTILPGYPRMASDSFAVDIEVNSATYTVGIALFAALVLGMGRMFALKRTAVCAAALLLLPAWGITFDVLRQLAAEPRLLAALEWPAFAREGIALGYQVGSLLLPTLAPVMLWAAAYPQLWKPTAPAGPAA